MVDAFHSITSYFAGVNSAGMYYGLFAVCLFAMFYIALLDKDDIIRETARRFYFAVTMIALIFLCPATVLFYSREISWSFGLPQFIRLVPVTPFIAMTAVAGSEYAFSQKRGAVRYPIAVILVIILCGSILPYSSNFNMKASFMSLEDFEKDKEIRDICNQIAAEFEEQKTVLSDMDTMPRLRRQSGQILPLYGPDMWNSVVNREYPYEGEHRYSDYMISLCGYMIGLDCLSQEVAADATVAYTDLYGAPHEIPCRELTDMALTHIRNTTAELLILRSPVSENSVVSEYLDERVWLKTKHYVVYLLR